MMRSARLMASASSRHIYLVSVSVHEVKGTAGDQHEHVDLLHRGRAA